MPQHDVEIADLDVQSKRLNVTTASKQLEVQERTSEIGKSQGEMLIEDAKYSEEAARNKARQGIDNARFNEAQAKRMLELSQLQLQWCNDQSADLGTGRGAPRIRRVARIGPAAARGRPGVSDEAADGHHRHGRMIVEAQIGEIDIGHVRTGQTARVYPRAAPGRCCAAR